MASILIGNWWALAIRGAVAILFGILAIVWPSMTATALVVLFGAYALIDGVFALVAAERASRRHGRSRALWVEAGLDFVIALIAFVFPHIALIVFVWLIAVWALFTGIALLAAGMALVRLTDELLVLVCGALSFLLGLILLFEPGAGVIALAWWLGIYAILFGAALLSAAFRLRWHTVG